jgi:NAD(P)-dependent dehydrogenase (short-subunit alcohol dehydrogenase family)
MARMQDKVALITGGESGIGLATARLFVSEGAKVHLVGIDEAKLKVAAGELGDENALASLADVTDEDAVKAAIAAGVDRYGRFDVLFSDAGISGAVAPIADYASDEFARTLAVHILGAFHILKHGAPHVPDGGSIIITSSVVGLMGFEGISGYVAAKHGQVGLMRSAAKELAPRRIRVNTLHPGPTSTASRTTSKCGRPASPATRQRGSSTSCSRWAGIQPGRDCPRRALSRLGRQRHDDLAHLHHRHRPERLTQRLGPTPHGRSGCADVLPRHRLPTIPPCGKPAWATAAARALQAPQDPRLLGLDRSMLAQRQASLAYDADDLASKDMRATSKPPHPTDRRA